MATASIIFDLIGRDRASGPIGKVGDSANDTGGKLDKFGKVGKLAGGAIALGMAGAVTAIAGVGKALATAMENEKATDRMAAALGATPAVAERYGKIASNLYAGAWGENLDEVAHAVEAVSSSFKGLANDAALEKVSAQALDFATIFETEVPDAVSKASTIMNAGLAKNATEAFDLLTAASQRVPAALRGDLLDAGEEYGQFFKAIGYNGEQAFSALVKGSEKGQYGLDKIGDAIKEFVTLSTELDNPAYATLGLDAQKMAGRILKGGRDAKSATNEIIDGLLAIKDPAAQAEAAVQLFGAPFEDLNKTQVPELLRSLRAGESGLGKWKGSIDRAGKTLNDNAATNLESFKRQISTTFVSFVGGKALPALNRFSKFLSANVGPTIDKVQPYLRKFGDYLGTKLPGIIDGLKDIFRDALSIIQSLWKSFGSTIVQYLRSSFANMQTILSGAFDVIRGIFKTVAALLKGDWRGVWNGVKLILRGAVKIVTGLVREMWNRIRAIFKAAGTILKGMVKTTWSGTIALFRAGNQKIVEGIRSLPGKLVAVAGKMLSAGKSLGGKLIEGLKKGITGIPGIIGNIATAAFDKLKDLINSAIDQINKNIPDRLGKGKLSIPIDPTPIPRLARGGPVRKGQPYIVGDRGPRHAWELFVPEQDGRVEPRVPSAAGARPMPGSSGGGTTIVNKYEITINPPVGSNPAAIGKELERVMIAAQRSLGRPFQFKTVTG